MSRVRKRYMFQEATKMPLQTAALILNATALAISIMIENSYLFLIITSLADNWL